MARDTSLPPGSSGAQEASGLSLARRLQTGSSTAWSDLVYLYGPLVDKWCRTSGIPVDDIPDLAQEVFLSAFRGVGRFDPQRPNATFRGWLWTVTRSRIVEFHRRGRERGAGGSTAWQAIAAFANPVPGDEPTEPDQAAALLHRALDQIKAEFTDKTWDLFWRTTVLGHPTDLVAEENDISPAAVRQAKSRVLRRLRRQLGDA